MAVEVNICPCNWPRDCVRHASECLINLFKCCCYCCCDANKQGPDANHRVEQELTVGKQNPTAESERERERVQTQISINANNTPHFSVGHHASNNTLSTNNNPHISVGRDASNNTVNANNISSVRKQPSKKIVNNNGVTIYAESFVINVEGGSLSPSDRVVQQVSIRFKKVAKLLEVRRLDIKASIKLAELSRNTCYAAYLIFKIDADNSEGLGQWQKAIVAVRDSNPDVQPYSSHEDLVCVDPTSSTRRARLPVKKPDGWMELKLGHFGFGADAGDEDEVVVALEDNNTVYVKRGLIVAAIEVRPIKAAKNITITKCVNFAHCG